MIERPLDLTRTARDISVTERGEFRSCRRRWMIGTIDNWSPKAPTWALEFGTGIHSALEEYYRLVAGWDEVLGDPLARVLMTFEEWYKEQAKVQAKLLGPLWTEEAKDALWDLRNIGRTMLTNYAEFSGDKAETDPWEIVAIEGVGPQGLISNRLPGYSNASQPFMHMGRILVPIVHPDTKKCLPGRPYLSGRIDLLVRRRDKLWVVDHKTTANAPNDRGIDFEDQITGYSYIVWRLTSMLVRGTIFNYLVKQEPKEPRRIQPTKTNPTGLSTAKDQLCLARDYRQALIEGGLMVKGSIPSTPHAECYASLLAKGWNPYFARFEVQRNLPEVLNFERRLYEEYKDMRSVYRQRERAYPNLSAWTCPSCPVAPVCQAMEEGSDVQDVLSNRFIQAPDRKAVR